MIKGVEIASILGRFFNQFMALLNDSAPKNKGSIWFNMASFIRAS